MPITQTKIFSVVCKILNKLGDRHKREEEKLFLKKRPAVSMSQVLFIRQILAKLSRKDLGLFWENSEFQIRSLSSMFACHRS